ncbi:hypothetical protein NL339_27375, partial [Klebsiella pneumoniae]|nr:hypothetical protein [Klebsiella pneumoniae]
MAAPSTTEAPPGGTPQLRLSRPPGRLGNPIFAGISTGAGVVILVILAAVAGFLIVRSWPALVASQAQYDEIGFMDEK